MTRSPLTKAVAFWILLISTILFLMPHITTPHPTVRTAGLHERERNIWFPTLTQPLGSFLSDRAYLDPLRALLLPTFGQDVNASAQPANETMIVADPTRPGYFIVGANSLNGVGHYATTDGGNTWQRGEFMGECCDPTAAYDHNGIGYMAMMRTPNSGYCPDAITLAKSADGGYNWTAAQPVLTPPSPNDTAYDKPWLTADTHAGSPFAGRLYLTFSAFYAPNCAVLDPTRTDAQVAWSSDGGTNWSAPINLNDAAHNQDPFTHPVVASNGTVYVAYEYQQCTTQCNNVPMYNILTRSTDGGLSWAPGITITNQPISYTGVFTNYHLRLWGSSTTTGLRHNDQAILGVNPTNPQEIYSMWTDGRWDSSFIYDGLTGQHADIAFTRSTNGGTTWTAPLRVNDDPAGNGKDQFFPWMVVGSNGTIHASWMDRRDTTAGFQYRPYYSQSTDGGQTWSANQTVSSFGSVANTFMGDYSGIAVNADNSLVLPVWTDSRNGQQAYTNRGVLITPTATATPAPSVTRTVTLSPSTTVTSTSGPPSVTLTATAINGTPSATLTATATSAPPSATLTAPATSAPPSATLTATATSAPPSVTLTPSVTSTAPASVTRTMMPPTVTRTAVATATPCTIRFSDVTDATAYYYQGVYYLACRGVISGYSDGTYRPFNNTTRGQMTKIVTLAFNVALVRPPAEADRTFTDVLPDNVFYQLIETAAARGIVSGYTCGGVNPQTGASETCDSNRRAYFRPSNFVTRGQLTKIVVIGAGWALHTPATPTFSDVPTGNVFYPFIETALCHGAISGYSDGTFRPNANAFRGQIAKIVYLAATDSTTGCGP